MMWLLVIGSRPLSVWFSVTAHADKGVVEEGGLIDVLIFFVLMGMGTIALAKRKVDWHQFISRNRWLVVFFFYCGVSVFWSDYPFVGFKRWTKDVANIIMLLIIFTEDEPERAIKAVWARYTYIVIPVSVLYIKFYPDLGRIYNQWTYEPAYVGLTSEKNTLGAVVLVSGLILVWDLIESWQKGTKAMSRVDLISRMILLLMIVWLLHMADSSTALVCFVIGVGTLVSMQFRPVLQQARRLGMYCLVAGLVGLWVYLSGIYEGFLEMIGEDPTLTGRTDTWYSLLAEPINPFLGTGGYRSFWTSSFAKNIQDHYYFYINQSHNGYLETYLNNGLIGLFLLLGLIVSVGITIRRELVAGNKFAILRLVFLFIILFSNWTEATFNMLIPIWFVFLLAAISYSHPSTSVVNKTYTGTVPLAGYPQQTKIA